MNIDQIIEHLNKTKKLMREEDRPDHKKVFYQIIEIYRNALKKEISIEAEKKLLEWAQEALEDSYR